MQWGKNWSESRELLDVIRRRTNGVVPAMVAINPVLWRENEANFTGVIDEAPDVFVVTSEDPARKEASKIRDAWGSLWHFPGLYLDGQVIDHPLADWKCWSAYTPPDPETFTDWSAARERVARAKREGRLAVGDVEHGFLYLRLQYLRGFENLMLDVAELRPELFEMIEMVAGYWAEVVRRWLDMGVDMIQFADDLGHQRSLPIRPDTWRRLLLPAMVAALLVAMACTSYTVLNQAYSHGASNFHHVWTVKWLPEGRFQSANLMITKPSQSVSVHPGGFVLDVCVPVPPAAPVHLTPR